MAYQGNPVETTFPVTSSSIVDGTIQETDLNGPLASKINGKQDALVSGTNIKTVNGQDLVGAGNVDLASLTEFLTNKTLIGPVIRSNIQVISEATSASAGTVYVLTSSLNLTFPATPTVGDQIGVINRSGVTTSVIVRNGSNIMGLAEDFNIDIENFSATFVYADATRGWVIV